MMQTRVPPGNLAIPLWRQIQALEPNLAVGGPETLAEVLKLNYREKGIDGALFLFLPQSRCCLLRSGCMA